MTLDITYCANGGSCPRSAQCRRYLTQQEKASMPGERVWYAAFYKNDSRCDKFYERTGIKATGEYNEKTKA